MAKRKTRVREHVIAGMSFHYLGYIIASAGFTLETFRSDYGYDLSVYTFDADGQYENGNMFVQLKATDGLKVDAATGEIKFRITKEDILMWEGELFPVYLVIFDAKGVRAYSLYLQKYLARAEISSATMKYASLEIRLPNEEVNIGTVQGWRLDKNRILEQRGEVTHV